MKTNGKNLKRRMASVLAALMLAETVLPGSMVSFAETVPAETDFAVQEEIAAAEAVEISEEEATAELTEEAMLEVTEKEDSATLVTEETATKEENQAESVKDVFEDDTDEEDGTELKAVPAGELVAAVASEGMSYEERLDTGLYGFCAGEEEEDLFFEDAEVGFEIDEETGYLRSAYVAEALPEGKNALNGTALLGAGETYYDGRDNFTGAKNQQGYNTCWAFSTAALAEASMIRKGKADKASVDYSELGLSYFMYNDESIVDPLELTKGDHAELSGGKSYVSVGGNPLFSMMALSGWKGMQNEADLPYSKIGQTGFTSKQCYDNNQAILRSSHVYNLTNRSLVKDAIKEYGGVTIELHAGSSAEYVLKGGKYYFWNDKKTSPDHSAVIVGWDDAVPAENFEIASPSEYVRKKPTKDGKEAKGAWLVRNSWGSGFGENGYFWLSYEDMSLGANAVAMEFMPKDTSTYKYNYHYDGTGGNATCTYKNEKDGKTYCYLAEGGSAGNIYRVSGDSAQLLTAVNVGFASPKTGYSIQIYTNTAKMKNPTDGTPALKTPITGTSDEVAGICTIDITQADAGYEQGIYLTKGEYFSVVVTAVKSPYTNKIVEMYTDKNLKSTDGSLLFVNNTAVGQSYVKSNSTSGWVDLKKSANEAMRSWTFRVKAFTKDTATRPIIPQTFEAETVVTEINKSEEVSFKVTPANATWERITCEVANGTYAAASVTADGHVKVTGLKKGNTAISCKIFWNGGSLETSASVKVVYRPDEMTFRNESMEVKRGSTTNLTPVFSCYLEDSERTTSDVYVDDYTFEWSSDDTSIVTVTPVGNGKTARITAKAVGDAYISVNCVDNRMLGAEIFISVTTSGGGGGGGTGGGGGGGGTGGGGGQKGVGPGSAAQTVGTFSKNWFQDASGLWKIKNKAGQIVTSAWLCDDAVTANGQNVWYLLDAAGNMVSGGCVQDTTGNIYSLEMNHNGYFGMLRYKNGNYTCEDGTTVYLEFSQAHDGTFGAVINQAGKEFLIKKYGITQFAIGNQNIQYTKSFE